MVTLHSVHAWHEYTKTRWEKGEGAGLTHLSEPYARETLCGLSKVNKPTVWEADGDGCEYCANEYLVRVVTTAVRVTGRFVNGE